MKHVQYLLELLKPLGVYDLNSGSVNRGELEAYGQVLDRFFEQLEGIERESRPVTAEGKGLELIQALLPHRPASGSVDELRQALTALLRIGRSASMEAINSTLSGCGIRAVAAEGKTRGQVQISFPDVKGVPPAFETLQAIIEEILPCHLEVTYLLWYNNWANLRELFPTFGDLESGGLSWQELLVLQA